MTSARSQGSIRQLTSQTKRNSRITSRSSLFVCALCCAPTCPGTNLLAERLTLYRMERRASKNLGARLHESTVVYAINTALRNVQLHSRLDQVGIGQGVFVRVDDLHILIR